MMRIWRLEKTLPLRSARVRRISWVRRVGRRASSQGVASSKRYLPPATFIARAHIFLFRRLFVVDAGLRSAPRPPGLAVLANAPKRAIAVIVDGSAGKRWSRFIRGAGAGNSRAGRGEIVPIQQSICVRIGGRVRGDRRAGLSEGRAACHDGGDKRGSEGDHGHRVLHYSLLLIRKLNAFTVISAKKRFR